MTRRGLLVLLVLWGTPCCSGPENSLGGSIDESYSLDFDTVRIRLVVDDLVIEYLKHHTSGAVDKVCKVVVEGVSEMEGLGHNTNIKGEIFLNRVHIQRATARMDQFPEVEGGSLHFDKYNVEAGKRVDGEFDALFVTGRTLHGTFNAKLEISDIG